MSYPSSKYLTQKYAKPGMPGGSVVECLPLAQGVILETWDQVLHRAPHLEPASPSACVSAPLSLRVSHD